MHRTRRGRRRRLGGDRGSVTTEVVLYAPLLFLLVLVGVQFALWALAQLGVQHAANHALQTTRVSGGTAAAGRADATEVLRQVAGQVVVEPRVSVTRTADTATVAVAGRVPAVVPFLRLQVSTQASAPVERFRPSTLSLASSPPGVEGDST
ncbi:pilus assembly protein [Micromonospora sp. R77]|uniref:TadE/TadG family type IV pilus assembly protein n=1 Tax=Micromonospora sp. R77 TaxID=2925836 RepID=UPI001F61258D|nr:TadE/TadG family type IV pilus assembly protein [Micromonospora sp. R77]MCI4064028.1 pilus assembly protein [Micromonospora sp. R77]